MFIVFIDTDREVIKSEYRQMEKETTKKRIGRYN